MATKLNDKPVLIYGPNGKPLVFTEKRTIGFGKPISSPTQCEIDIELQDRFEFAFPDSRKVN